LSYSKKGEVKKMDIAPLLLSFKGRISRSQFNFWWLPLTFLPIIIFSLNEYVAGILMLLLLWPLFALTTKRYHDFGSSGVLGILQILPFMGWLIVFVGCSLTIGDFKDNKYGGSTYGG
jgi:uncharacterized membrane protein YhaH (DUF805 family)